MTIKEALKYGTNKLRKTSKSPVLDAEVLLSFVLKKTKAYLFTYPQKQITKDQQQKYKKLIARRRKYEPIAYITKHREFFGLDFYIDKRVLIPRPETETLVESVLKKIKNPNKKLVICDVGTGSGCIAISLAYYLLKSKIYAVDISKNALKVAKVNGKKFKLSKRIKFIKSDLLSSIPKQIKFDIIVANLPYLTLDQLKKTEKEIKLYEPKTTLLAGKEETKIYKRLLSQIPQYLKRNGLVFLEIDPKFKNKIIKEIKKKFKKVSLQIKKDLAGQDRILELSKIK